MIKRFFVNLYQKFAGVVFPELRPQRLLRSIIIAAILAFLFNLLISGDLSFLAAFLFALAGYYMMRIVAYQIKQYLVNREEVLAEAETEG